MLYDVTPQFFPHPLIVDYPTVYSPTIGVPTIDFQIVLQSIADYSTVYRPPFVENGTTAKHSRHVANNLAMKYRQE